MLSSRISACFLGWKMEIAGGSSDWQVHSGICPVFLRYLLHGLRKMSPLGTKASPSCMSRYGRSPGSWSSPLVIANVSLQEQLLSLPVLSWIRQCGQHGLASDQEYWTASQPVIATTAAPCLRGRQNSTVTTPRQAARVLGWRKAQKSF